MLILVDGVKVKDDQTDPQLMNTLVPFKALKRMEIIKRTRARVYRPNTFSGAIKIITKAEKQQSTEIEGYAASFNPLCTHFNHAYKTNIFTHSFECER